MNEPVEDRVLEIIEEALIDSLEFGDLRRRSDRIYFRDIESSAWYEVIVQEEENDHNDIEDDEDKDDSEDKVE